MHITELLLRKHRLLKYRACTKYKHGPLVSEKDAVVSPAMQPFSGGTHQRSPSPKSQPDPAHQTCAKSSVNCSGIICQLSILRADSLHDCSLLLVAKMHFQEVCVALRGHAKDICLCRVSFSLEDSPMSLNIELQQCLRVPLTNKHTLVKDCA